MPSKLALLSFFSLALPLTSSFIESFFLSVICKSVRAAFLSFALFRSFKILGGRFKSFAEDLDSPIMFVCCGRFLARCKGGRGISLDFFFEGEMFRRGNSWLVAGKFGCLLCWANSFSSFSLWAEFVRT